MELGAAVLIMMDHAQPHVRHDKLARVTTSAIEAEAPIFADDASKLRTAALVVAVMERESSFRDVVSHTGDYCEMQIHKRPDLQGHTFECIRTGIHMLRDALTKCSGIQSYVGAPQGCHDVRATRISDDRIKLAGELLAALSASGSHDASLLP